MEKENSIAYEIVQDYKASNKRKDIMIFVLISIIGLFVAGLVYFVTNFELSYDETYSETSTGNACVGDNCNNGEIINGEGI